MFRKTVRSVSNIFKFSSRCCSCPCHPSETPPDTKLCILENGVRVATESTGSSMACVSLFIEAGSRFETACNNGITHFVERMAYKGFNCMPKRKLEDMLLGMGAKMTSQTTREIQIFSAKCLPESVPDIVGVLANIITDLALLENEIENEKKNMELEMLDEDRNHRNILFDYLHLTAFQGTPLAKRVIGSSDNISRFDKIYTSSFMTDHYQPYKLALVSVGNVEHDSMVNYANARFGNMVGDPCCESQEGHCRFTGSEVLFRNDALPYAHIALAFEVPGYGSHDYLALMTAKAMIGTWNKGMGGLMDNSSPLARAGSVANLCDYYEAFYIPYRDIGLWGMYFVSKKMDVEDMLYNVQKNWMSMCVTIQYYEGQKAVNAMKLETARRFDGANRSCNDLGYQTIYSGGRDGTSDIFHDLQGINYLNVKSAMEQWIYDRCPAVAGVGPTEGLPEYNRIRAGQYWLRL